MTCSRAPRCPADRDDEFDETSPSHSQLLTIPAGSVSQIMENIRDISHARTVSADSTTQMTATALSILCDIFGVTADEGWLSWTQAERKQLGHLKCDS